MNPVLAEATRGGHLESVHRGAIAVLDADGGVLLSIGDIDRPVFARSAVKVLQALPLVASGAADQLGLNDAELAVACASHNGEALHVETVAGLLEKAGLDASALECGTHWPYLDSAARTLAADGQMPNALHNNCSGKHAGFLCLACGLHGSTGLRGFSRGYVRAEHPVMREVTAALQAVTGFDLARAPAGIDGCSIPAFAIPLRHLAHGFARIGSGSGLHSDHARAATRLRQAVAAAPFMVGGTDRFDTQVMEALGERVFCKVGAEGVYCAAFPERGLGVAIKIDDGNTARACEVVMAGVIAAFVTLDEAERSLIDRLADVRLLSRNAVEVGRLTGRALSALT